MTDTLTRYVKTRDRGHHRVAERLRAQVVQENTGLAASVARRLVSDPERLDDCIQAALVKLLEILPKYDPTRGTLATFAWPYLRGAVIAEFHSTTGLGLSLDAPLGDGTTTRLDALAAPTVEPREPTRELWLEQLAPLLGALPPEQSALLRLRYGIRAAESADFAT
jgi:RNA polymerase sigma factor (sigma-70 family)